MNTPHSQPDLTQCDREPIHTIPFVQPFGGLIELNADWMVAHRSANCAALLGLAGDLAVGARLADVFSPRACEMLQQCVRKGIAPDRTERIFGLRLTADSGLFDCALHLVGERIVMEFEPHAGNEYAQHVAMIAPMLARLEPITQLNELCAQTAALVRENLGYDRVMIYRFHPDGSGEVIAEDRGDATDGFLGLRYPRTDIPQQARDLFRRNRFRVIADVDQEPSPIEPPVAMGGRPLDLSLSVLRASSDIHLQYLRNMGVRASLTIAIVCRGQLWGLIACHHNTPRLPPYSLRTVAETLSQMFSLVLDRMLINRSEKLRSQGRELHDQLMQRLAGGTQLAESLPMLEGLLHDVIAHDGASILINGEYSSRGVAPTHKEFMALAPALGGAPVSTIIAESALAQLMPAAQAFSDRAAGALILPISRSPRDYLVLWRQPLKRTVTWAGNPEKAVINASDRLQPRRSFAAWEQQVEGHSEDWTADEIELAETLRVTLLEVVLRMSEEVTRERNRSAEQQGLLIAELNHRVRNILNLIRSLVAQSQHDALDVESFSTIIGGRITALASAHDNITRKNWTPAPLALLFETELAAYLNEKRDRFTLTGEEVLVTPEAYTVLALVVHELVTNSAKYGSLCDRSGSLDVNVSRDAFGDVKIAWRESGGPPVKPPTRRGFGSTIIERSIPFELKGEASLRFNLGGLEADFVIPAQYVTSPGAGSDAPNQNTRNTRSDGMSSDESGGGDNAPAQDEPDVAPSLPRTVLVVEDSMIIALDTEDSLKALGIANVQLAGSVAGALNIIATGKPDFAIVDYNLGDETSAAVTKELARRGVPFVLATGYSEMNEQSDGIGAMAVLRKPYGRTEIAQVLAELTARGGEASAS